MKPTQTFENRLESTGTALRDRPSLVDRVMTEILQTASKAAARTREQAQR